MHILRAILRLIRLDTSLLGFFAILIPLWVRTNDFVRSLRTAVPLLFICMCTFIANDLDDLEKDIVNHPDRPLPRRHVGTVSATGLYFVILGASLLSTWSYVSEPISFCYYTLIALSISYSYVVEFLPSLKAPYVGLVSSLPVVIVAALYPSERRLYLTVGAVFLLITAREIYMDLNDRGGDAASFVQRINPKVLANTALTFQLGGLMLLGVQVEGALDVLVLCIMISFLGVIIFYWLKSKYRLSVVLMKLQLFVGLYFLT